MVLQQRKRENIRKTQQKQQNNINKKRGETNKEYKRQEYKRHYYKSKEGKYTVAMQMVSVMRQPTKNASAPLFF